MKRLDPTELSHFTPMFTNHTHLLPGTACYTAPNFDVGDDITFMLTYQVRVTSACPLAFILADGALFDINRPAETTPPSGNAPMSRSSKQALGKRLTLIPARTSLLAPVPEVETAHLRLCLLERVRPRSAVGAELACCPPLPSFLQYVSPPVSCLLKPYH